MTVLRNVQFSCLVFTVVWGTCIMYHNPCKSIPRYDTILWVDTALDYNTGTNIGHPI
jgi:hypothetical protein